MIGQIRKILKFSIVDGPGNRSAIFLQGCNFDCAYCHNPETIPQISATPMTAADVFSEIGSAVNFIRGITVSGGEPTLQRDFIIEFFKTAKAKQLTTFIDTNGSYLFEEDRDLLTLTDGVMLDVKIVENHPNVEKNIRFLAEENKLHEIRTVISSSMKTCEDIVSNTAKLIARHPEISYKLIKYRENGVRENYRKTLVCPDDEFMEHLKKIAILNGATNTVVV
jgi:pyruvate-formate lyase-activating enzyme